MKIKYGDTGRQVSNQLFAKNQHRMPDTWILNLGTLRQTEQPLYICITNSSHWNPKGILRLV